MKAISIAESSTREAERRWVLAGVAVAAALVCLQVVGGLVREAVTDEPTHLELVQTCLAERSTPFAPVSNDPVALSAKRGALRTTVQGNSVTVALGESEDDAERVFQAYASVAGPGVVGTSLERRRKVVFLWDGAPTTSQRAFMELCTRDAQE